MGSLDTNGFHSNHREEASSERDWKYKRTTFKWKVGKNSVSSQSRGRSYKPTTTNNSHWVTGWRTWPSSRSCNSNTMRPSPGGETWNISVGIAIINNPVLMVYTTHLWWWIGDGARHCYTNINPISQTFYMHPNEPWYGIGSVCPRFAVWSERL